VRTANPTPHRNLDQGRGPIGAFSLDISGLSNGLHTIVWGVTDSAGRGEGIGSRYFTVLKSSDDTGVASLASADVPVPTTLRNAPAERRGQAADPERRSVASRGVQGRTGFDLSGSAVETAPDEAGVRHVQMASLGRLELQLAPVDAGYLVANGTLHDLPPGSHLEPATGAFTWAPGVGYHGTYRLMFVRGSEQILVDVRIRPMTAAGPSESEIRMQVDRPAGVQSTSGRVQVAGWALDPQADIGSGIEAVHVWAQRRDTIALPEFLGAADLRVARPDAAQESGAQFGAAGYSLTATLAPGQYDITVVAWNRRTARWEDARTFSVAVR
jgi:hypothetical protein